MSHHNTGNSSRPAQHGGISAPKESLVFISAAEPSADRHSAELVRTAKALIPSVRFVGVAGPRMVEAGCERIFDMSSHSAMLAAALGNVGRGIRMLNTADAHLRSRHFAAAVLTDSPTLHLPLAGRARSAGVPVLYYIAPQMWAWGAHRIYKLRHRVDKLAVILPFEEEYFRNQGVDATFVGHPLAEQIARYKPDITIVNRLRQRGEPFIALLPGSRAHVVSAVLPGQLEVAESIQKEFPRTAFVVSIANPQTAPIVEAMARRCSARVSLHQSDLTEMIVAADLVLVTSGTTALEVAFHAKPMIVMYQSSRLLYHAVARWMIHTPFLSLPNILAGRAVVPEFMPYYTSTTPIAACALELLRDEYTRNRMIADLWTITNSLRDRSASVEVAEMLAELIQNVH